MAQSTVQQFIEAVRNRLRDQTNATFSDPSLFQFLCDALDEHNNLFPRGTTATVALTANQREYSLSSYPELQRITRLEYPLGLDPPKYLTPRAVDDPEGFWGRPGYFDLWGEDPPDTLVIGEKPVAGQSLRFWYTYDHAYPDAVSDALTIPNRDLNIPMKFVEWSAMCALRNGEMGQPTLNTLLISQLDTVCGRLRREYDALVARRQRFGTYHFL